MKHELPRQWHRLFGIVLTDVFSGSRWRVELEKELALQSQLLDVVIIEQVAGAGRDGEVLPDGLEGLRAHNLLTYKSLHEALDGWALEELVGHYVNYRKLAAVRGPDNGRSQVLLPETEFQLYAVTTRYPHKLGRTVALEPTAWEGVFDLAWGTRTIRLIVLSRIAAAPRNAAWELFSARMKRVRHGAEHFRAHSRGAETLLYEVYLRLTLELPNMAYTMDDFIRESHQHMLSNLSPAEREAFLNQLPVEERLRGLPVEERLRGLPVEERLRGLPVEERLRGLPAEERLRGLPAEERLRGLPAEERLRGLSAEELRRLQEELNRKLN